MDAFYNIYSKTFDTRSISQNLNILTCGIFVIIFACFFQIPILFGACTDEGPMILGWFAQRMVVVVIINSILIARYSKIENRLTNIEVAVADLLKFQSSEIGGSSCGDPYAVLNEDVVNNALEKVSSKFDAAYGVSWTAQALFFFELALIFLVFVCSQLSNCSCRLELSFAEWITEFKEMVKAYSKFN